MKYLTFIPLMWILFISSLNADTIDVLGLEGQWHGDVSMVDHHHLLTFTLKRNKNQDFDVSYRFWDMEFVDYGEIAVSDNHFSVLEDTFELVLGDAGIHITGSVTSASKMQGIIKWMGRTQPITLIKVDAHGANQGSEQHSSVDDEKMNVAVLIFDGVDALDWAGPLEVFDYAHAFNTYTVAADIKPKQGGAYKVLPNYTFETMPEADIVVIPGGSISQLFLDQRTRSWLQQMAGSAKHIMSVCNASTLLASNDLLTGLEATTHGAWLAWLNEQSQEYDFKVVDDRRFTDNGHIITTAGVSSGIDGALHLVAKLKGLKHAKMTAMMMEYGWQPEADYKQE